MEIIKFTDGFITRYATGFIKETVVYYDSNRVVFSFFSGKTVQIKLPDQIEEGFYNSQFGISITKDGRYFFIQSWEKNTVYCFRIADCMKMWATKIRHPYGLCVCDEFLICYAMHDGVYKIALDKGSVVSHFKCAYTKFFSFLGDSMFLIGPLRNKYKVMDFDFRQLSSLAIDNANPNKFDTFLITEATLSGKLLTLKGFEYNSIDLCGLTYQEQETRVEHSRFCREIEISMPFTDVKDS